MSSRACHNTTQLVPDHLLVAWSAALTSSLTTLRHLAGTTEHEFLEIGSKVQEVYLSAVTLSGTARHLAEIASGERIHSMTGQLRQILHDMGIYLEQTQLQSLNHSVALKKVNELLTHIAEPLEGFKKMSKNLYILEVLVKIESATLEKKGDEFTNLAFDINKLSQQIKEKASIIHEKRISLANMLKNNITKNSDFKYKQEEKIEYNLKNTEKAINELEFVNQKFSSIGNIISKISHENSDNISDVVQSMQLHDIFRQQVEHVIESIELLIPLVDENKIVNLSNNNTIKELISKTGDVCELQEAQLQFACSELHAAVSSIIVNLENISRKQKSLTDDIHTQSGVIDAPGTSFIDGVSLQMSSVTELLTNCAEMNIELAGIMREITATIEAITSFVSDIEEIGQEVILLALNARIMAATTGREGASLCVLAEEIGHISKEDIGRTETIAATLKEIHTATEILTADTSSNEGHRVSTLSDMKTEMSTILGTLESMSVELLSLLSRINEQTNSLTREIEAITSGLDIHQRIKAMADNVLTTFKQIMDESRALFPASAVFKEDLRRLAERYTMESERRIHEGIARKHGLELAATTAGSASSATPADSEFGDNIDLF